MEIISTRPDGLHISASARLAELVATEMLSHFAGGLLIKALASTSPAPTLAEMLYDTGPHGYPLFTALLVLDAEVTAVVAEKKRAFPLPAFLAYRAALPPDKFVPHTLRLPPHNPGGHYCFAVTADGSYVAVRLHLHPHLRVAGHVRIALSSPLRPPVRLVAAEGRLEWQLLRPELIAAALAAGSQGLALPLSTEEQSTLTDLLGTVCTP
jgi:hypothetical protein